MKHIYLAFSIFLLGVGCISSPTSLITEPTVDLEKVYEGQVEVPIWLFAVEDDKGRVVLSAELSQGIVMAFFDPENPDAKLNWETIVSRDEVGGVADHWHVFAHGYHYLVFSQPSAESAYAVKVDQDLKRVAMEHIVNQYELSADEQSAMGDREYLITNDMFLVPEDEGVTAAFFLPGIGHKLFRMDEDLQVYDTINIGGGDIEHGNGSSAIQTEDGFEVLACDTIMHLKQSGITKLVFDKEWNFVEAQRLLDIDNQAMSMTSGVYLPDGSLVVHTRVNVNAYGRGQMPPPSSSKNGELTDDGGNIGRYIFGPDGDLWSTEYLFEGTNAHRPHTLLAGDYLITTWDGGEKGKGATIRIDRMQYQTF